MAERLDQERFTYKAPWKTRRRLLRPEIVVPFLFFITIIAGFRLMMGESLKPATYIRYSTVTGFFQQDDPATDADGFDYTATNFGLIDQKYDTDAEYEPDHPKSTLWERFAYKISKLNDESGSNVHYKLFYFGRHGEGYHNVAEAVYGTKAWDCYWSLQDGDSTNTWADSALTPIGKDQALAANAFWAHQISTQNIPLPESYYSSPLTRCLQTGSLTFTGLDLSSGAPYVPVVKELFRESIGVHTCDRRSSKTVIGKHFTDALFEEGFEEDDPLWDPAKRETDVGMDLRIKVVLDDVFGSEKNVFISVTAHSAAIGGILRVLGHRPFSLGTGQAIPVLIKAEVVEGSPPPPTVTGPLWSTPTTCAEPPPTSTL